MRIAIVHPWYLANGGAEHTVNELARLYPTADFFTLFYEPSALPSNLKGRRIIACKYNWLPAKYKLYRYLLPVYPLLFESLDLRGYDLIISSDSCVAKGVLVDQGATHVCYCHSPMRCLWDLRWEFLQERSAVVRPVFSLGAHYVRQWDFAAAQRVDSFVANSHNVAQRVSKYFRRSSIVIYPPVDTQSGFISDRPGDYYLSVGRLTETKRIDLLIHACNRLRRKLIIAGAGREEKNLKAIAGPTIQFAGRVPREELRDLYANCRAFLFAANEDFGIVPVEAQSYGRPVIAYGRGGSLETIVQPANETGLPPTGVFFDSQTASSLEEAILDFEEIGNRFNPIEIQQHARRFDAANFAAKFARAVEDSLANVATLGRLADSYATPNDSSHRLRRRATGAA